MADDLAILLLAESKVRALDNSEELKSYDAVLDASLPEHVKACRLQGAVSAFTSWLSETAVWMLWMRFSLVERKRQSTWTFLSLVLQDSSVVVSLLIRNAMTDTWGCRDGFRYRFICRLIEDACWLSFLVLLSLFAVWFASHAFSQSFLSSMREVGCGKNVKRSSILPLCYRAGCREHTGYSPLLTVCMNWKLCTKSVGWLFCSAPQKESDHRCKLPVNVVHEDSSYLYFPEREYIRRVQFVAALMWTTLYSDWSWFLNSAVIKSAECDFLQYYNESDTVFVDDFHLRNHQEIFWDYVDFGVWRCQVNLVHAIGNYTRITSRKSAKQIQKLGSHKGSGRGL